jgi:hypothetical protein
MYISEIARKKIQHRSNPVDSICPGKRCLIACRFFPQLGLFADILFLSLISAGENYKEGAGVGAQRPIFRVDEPIKTSVQGRGA